MTITNANLELTSKKWPSIQKMAKKGHPEAMYLMGVAYLVGGFVDIDPSKAYNWFERAALKDHADAAFRCGFIIVHYQEKIQTDKTALQWFEKASELGSPAGQCAVGNMWTTYKIKTQRWWNRWIYQYSCPDAKKAYSLYCTAAQQEYTPAIYFKGLHQRYGWGTTKNKEYARETWKQACAHNDKDSAYAISQTYSYNDPQYWEYLEKSADWGHSQAQWKLALALQAKRDDRSKEQAITWLRRSAMQRNPNSMLLLSQTLFYGRGVAPNPIEAYQWARRCAMLSGCSSKWPQKILATLDKKQQEYESLRDEEDNKTFMSITNKLFGTHGGV